MVPVTSRAVGESHRRHGRVLAVMVALLVLTHVVQWQPGREPMLLGFLPWDLAYHLLWMVAATVVVLYMTEVVWRHPPEDDPP